jgi:DNA-directed RNA polymerase subunit RPC12/RpoP
MKTFHVPKAKCLGCGAPNDAASDTIGGNKPSEGDVAVCMYCGHISVFNADLTLRNPNDEEMLAIAGDQRILKIQQARAKTNIKPWKDTA